MVSILYLEEKAYWISLMNAYWVVSDETTLCINKLSYCEISGFWSWVIINYLDVDPTLFDEKFNYIEKLLVLKSW